MRHKKLRLLCIDLSVKTKPWPFSSSSPTPKNNKHTNINKLLSATPINRWSRPVLINRHVQSYCFKLHSTQWLLGLSRIFAPRVSNFDPLSSLISILEGRHPASVWGNGGLWFTRRVRSHLLQSTLTRLLQSSGRKRWELSTPGSKEKKTNCFVKVFVLRVTT